MTDPSFVHLLNNDPPSDWEQRDMHNYSQNFEPSQIPNQDFIANIDDNVYNLPKQIYINTLLKLVNYDDNLITWYRSVLLSCAQAIEGCPAAHLNQGKHLKGELARTNMPQTVSPSIAS